MVVRIAGLVMPVQQRLGWAVLFLLLWPLWLHADEDCLQLAELCRASCPRQPLTADDSQCSSRCADTLGECVDSGHWPGNERPVASQPSAEELNVSILQWRDERRPQLLEQQARFAELRDLFELLPEPSVGQRFVHPSLTLVLTAGGELVQLDASNRQLLQRQRLAPDCEQLSYGPANVPQPPTTAVRTAPAANSGGPTPAAMPVAKPADLALLCSDADGRRWRWQASPEPARQRSANWTDKGLLLWQPHSAGWQLQLLAPGAATGQQLWQLPASAEAPLLLGAALDGQWAVVEQNEAFWLLRAGVAEQHQSLAAEQLLVDEQQRLLQLEGDTLLLDRLTASGTERLYRRRLPVAEQSILAALPGSEQLLLAHVDAGQDAWVVTLYDHQLGTVLGSGVLADLSPFELPQAQVSDDGSRVYLALGDERWLEIDPQRLRPDALVPAAVEAEPAASSAEPAPAGPAPAAPALTPAKPQPVAEPSQPAAPVAEPQIAG